MKKGVDIDPSWVYCMADYCQMFDLSDADLERSLLDYPAGISSFNAEMFVKGHRVHSGDVVYELSPEAVAVYAKKLFQINEAHLRQHYEILREHDEQTLEGILSDWQKSKALFLEDYEKGKEEERYQFMKLPHLPFADYTFDMALCSGHLFHSAATPATQRETLVEELCRVAKEVRIFPLLDEKGNITDALGHVMLAFQNRNYGIKVCEVSYHQMKGGNAMLKIWSTECPVES